jgi:glycerol-3-phosphate dehydrogenase subunit B
MSNSHCLKCDLAVIGAGMTGMAAALFAANRGLAVIQAGRPGGIIFASGLLDLMGVHPAEKKKSWFDPWAAVDRLIEDIPEHPYSRLKRTQILAAFDELLSFLEGEGIPYCRRLDRNCQMITSLGTVKTTYCVPQSMWAGVRALAKNTPCLIIDFEGLKDFSARRIVATLGDQWPALSSARIPFPGTGFGHGLVTGEMMALSLEARENRSRLAESLQPLIKHACAVGLPAVCGMRGSHEIIADLEKEIGLPLFEIPTIPPSVPGMRLKEAFERGLARKGVRQLMQKRVLEVCGLPGGEFMLSIGGEHGEYRVQATGVVLASGRFMGGGLYGERNGIRETVFDLPVHQPANRAQWHRNAFLDSRGHPISRAGLGVDHSFRPLESSGRPAFSRLFAAGSILAHQDWMRMKCGSGLAIATAYGAVEAFLNSRR